MVLEGSGARVCFILAIGRFFPQGVVIIFLQKPFCSRSFAIISSGATLVLGKFVFAYVFRQPVLWYAVFVMRLLAVII